MFYVTLVITVNALLVDVSSEEEACMTSTWDEAIAHALSRRYICTLHIFLVATDYQTYFIFNRLGFAFYLPAPSPQQIFSLLQRPASSSDHPQV